MIKKNINLVSGIIFALSIGYHIPSKAIKTLFKGTIQFPHTISIIPNVRIYSAGYKIKNETTAHGLSFEFPEEKNRKKFTILVTEKIDFMAEPESNTIQYLKIPRGQSYKYYSVVSLKNGDEILSDATNNGKKNVTPQFEWRIAEETLPYADGRILDDTIIICFNPSYVDRLEGGGPLELPKIVVKKNIVQLAGSEDNLHDATTALLLSSLDTDTIHGNIQQEKKDYQRTRITMIAA